MAEFEKIVAELRDLRSKAYCPASRFAVAAVVKSAGGKTFGGANVENASFGLTVCAERNALFRMVAEIGHDFVTDIWLMAGPAAQKDGDFFTTPCGACRQVMGEFCKPESKIHAVTLDGKIAKTISFAELLPDAFSFHDLKDC